MPSLNRVTLIGHLGRDPEIRSTQYGDRVMNLSIATEERWKDKNSGEWKGRTEWHRVVAYDDRAIKYAESYLRKGSTVYVEGQLQTRKWSDKDGQERYTTEVVIQKFRGELMGLDKADRPVSDEAPGRGRSVADELGDQIPF